MSVRCDIKDCISFKKMNIQECKIVPYEIINPTLNQLFSYFQFRAPGVSSPHSRIITNESKQSVFQDFISSRNIVVSIFSTNEVDFTQSLERYVLDSDDVCYKCKRLICKKKKSKDTESDFDCLIRHLRNSIAHGRVSFSQLRGSFIYFEDRDQAGITAKIILNREDLKYLRKIINNNSIKQNQL